MSHKKEIVTAVGTLAIAVGIGFVMQSSEAAQERYGKHARPPVAEHNAGHDLMDKVSSAELIPVHAIELTSAREPASTPTETLVQQVSASVDDAPVLPVDDAVPRLDNCAITASATTLQKAMVRVSLDAPCAQNERLTVHHNGMVFAAATDATGALTLSIPALTREAVFILAFADGDGAVATATVEEVDNYDRVALQWRGDAGFQLHAREFGAEYGEAGHIWSGMPDDGSDADADQRGYLTRLGDPDLSDPLLAEVYTFATGLSSRAGVIDLSVEAEVTRSNCDVEVEAQTLELNALRGLTTRDLTLAMPGCDAVGDFLVLNNLVADMKVASN